MSERSMTRDERQRQRYKKWWENRSAAEFELHCLVGELEQSHFADMRLATPQIRRSLLRHQVLVDGKWLDDEDDVNLSLDDRWTFQFRRFRRDIIGLCDFNRHTWPPTGHFLNPSWIESVGSIRSRRQ
jgi:hypothetical protein